MIRSNFIISGFVKVIIVCLCIFLIYDEHLKYFLLDFKPLAISFLNPSKLASTQPLLFSLILLGISLPLVILLRVSLSFRGIKSLVQAITVFSFVWIATFFASALLPLQSINEFKTKILHRSDNFFVRVIDTGANAYREPRLNSPIIRKLPKGTIALLVDVKRDKVTWNKILIDKNTFAWSPRTRSDKQKTRLLSTYRAEFTWLDAASYLAGLVVAVSFSILNMLFKIQH